ncbi:MAG: hypothetical protein E6Q36_02735 [Chryseobacterium sp.]|nr:MAG: hypothetical protein E6Q36_02735 [Chryseobacterium sp.]
MSNMLSIIPTKFENVRSGATTYGVRVYDSYESAYDNTWDSIPDDDVELYWLVMENSDMAKIVNDYFESKEIDDPDPTIMIGDQIYLRSQLNEEKNES